MRLINRKRRRERRQLSLEEYLRREAGLKPSILVEIALRKLSTDDLLWQRVACPTLVNRTCTHNTRNDNEPRRCRCPRALPEDFGLPQT